MVKYFAKTSLNRCKSNYTYIRTSQRFLVMLKISQIVSTKCQVSTMSNKIVLLALLILPSCTILSACVHIFVLWQLQKQIYTLQNLKQRIAHHCCKCKSHFIMNPCSSFELTKFNFMRYVNLIHVKTC
jgi:hypothetical protein